MFENMVLRRIFGPRRDEVTGKWSVIIMDTDCVFLEIGAEFLYIIYRNSSFKCVNAF